MFDRLALPAFAVGAIIPILLGMTSLAHAHDLDVRVVDRDGAGVPGIAVYVVEDGAVSSNGPRRAVMDQVDTRFVPHILVVQKGTAVEFPNSDVVAHHVYSFSKPNNFVLPLYKGDPHDPITFKYDGIVTLGCNIHDNMLGYIVVVDTDVFGVTDEDGRIRLALKGSHSGAAVNIWSPRIRDSELTKKLGTDDHSVTFSLSKKLRPAHDSQSDAVEWSEY